MKYPIHRQFTVLERTPTTSTRARGSLRTLYGFTCRSRGSRVAQLQPPQRFPGCDCLLRHRRAERCACAREASSRHLDLRGEMLHLSHEGRAHRAGRAGCAGRGARAGAARACARGGEACDVEALELRRRAAVRLAQRRGARLEPRVRTCGGLRVGARARVKAGARVRARARARARARVWVRARVRVNEGGEGSYGSRRVCAPSASLSACNSGAPERSRKAARSS